MKDNPVLTEENIRRAESLYSGVFYKRYILGAWVVAEGIVYDMFDDNENTFDDMTMPKGLKKSARRFIAVDYGTVNPMVFLDCYDDDDVIWVVDEY